MKLIIAFVKPFKIDEVKDAVQKHWRGGMSVTEVKGSGREKARSEVFRGIEYTADLLPKGRIEIAVPDEHVVVVVAEIVRAAKTGRAGDGLVFVLPLDQVVRVRTDECGVAAL